MPRNFFAERAEQYPPTHKCTPKWSEVNSTLSAAFSLFSVKGLNLMPFNQWALVSVIIRMSSNTQSPENNLQIDGKNYNEHGSRYTKTKFYVTKISIDYTKCIVTIICIRHLL